MNTEERETYVLVDVYENHITWITDDEKTGRIDTTKGFSWDYLANFIRNRFNTVGTRNFSVQIARTFPKTN
jgi:hypothetical protein